MGSTRIIQVPNSKVVVLKTIIAKQIFQDKYIFKKLLSGTPHLKIEIGICTRQPTLLHLIHLVANLSS